MHDVLKNAPGEVLPPVVELNYRCLKAIVVHSSDDDDEEELVKMEQFGAVLDWFGNLEKDGPNILDKIKKILAQGWFHGDVSTGESENRLIGKTIGTFLVQTEC